MKNNYVTPEIEVVVLDTTDVLTASPATASTPIIDIFGGDPLDIGL